MKNLKTPSKIDLDANNLATKHTGYKRKSIKRKLFNIAFKEIYKSVDLFSDELFNDSEENCNKITSDFDNYFKKYFSFEIKCSDLIIDNTNLKNRELSIKFTYTDDYNENIVDYLTITDHTA